MMAYGRLYLHTPPLDASGWRATLFQVYIYTHHFSAIICCHYARRQPGRQQFLLYRHTVLPPYIPWKTGSKCCSRRHKCHLMFFRAIPRYMTRREHIAALIYSMTRQMLAELFGVFQLLMRYVASFERENRRRSARLFRSL